ncbi:MAG: DNA polymerase I [Clostridiales bacterium]|nr:DNA polymerase I [Clostridiales bacterium]
MKKFLIVDGNSLANRAYYAMPFLTNRQKRPSGAVFGFANLLIKIIQEQAPDYVAVAFDHARKTFRNEIYAEYKGTRKETPEDLRLQFPVIKEMLQVMGIKIFEQEGIEADDIIGTLAKNSDCFNVLLSGDRDLLQLINPSTSVWLTRKGVTETEKFDEVYLKQTWGLKPSGIVDLKALMGDSSDNIPGVAGVGEKTALSLLEKFETLEGVYNHIEDITGKLKDKLQTGKENAFMSHKLATIKTDCELDFSINDCVYDFPFSEKVRKFFSDWDFRSLLNRKDVFVEQTKREEFVLENLQQVENMAKDVSKIFCYDLKNLKFCVNQKVYCIKKEIDLFSIPLDFDQVLKTLKPIFEDENIIKITTSSKSDIKILKRNSIKLNNFFDIDIARYVLFAGLPKLPDPEVYEYENLKTLLEKQMKAEDVEGVYSKIELPLVSVLADMEDEGFKINQTELDELSQKYETEISSLTKEIFELAGEEFNINSPKQVANILFNKLELRSWNNKKQSTSFAILDEMRWQHKIVDLIIDYRKKSKLLSTYINVYKQICANGGDVVRTMFNQTLTSTGRLSSSEPNLQNIPTRDEEGRNLRKIFVSKYEDGNIISADYSQIELRLLANLAKEESMIEAYKKGIDIHTKTASEIFGVDVEKVTSDQRRDAKAVNFGIIYGISDFGLSQNIKTTRNQAKSYIDNYFSRYPKIKTFMDGNVEYAEKNGFVKSYFGRIRHIPEIQSSNGNTKKFGERVAMNMPLQGTASDVIKLAMIDVFKKLREKNMKSHIILQIHDELIIDAPIYEVESVKSLLKESMENVCAFEVPLTVSISNGKNLFDCK